MSTDIRGHEALRDQVLSLCDTGLFSLEPATSPVTVYGDKLMFAAAAIELQRDLIPTILSTPLCRWPSLSGQSVAPTGHAEIRSCMSTLLGGVPPGTEAALSIA